MENWTNQYENELRNMEFWASESEGDEFVNTIGILPCFFVTMPKISLQSISKKNIVDNSETNSLISLETDRMIWYLQWRYQIILPVVLFYNISILFSD